MDVGMEVLSIKENFCFIKEFSKRVWEKNTSGTGGSVPGRYGGIPVGLVEMYLGGTVESWKSCFGHTEMAGKENGSPLPISLQRNLFSKGFSTKI